MSLVNALLGCGRPHKGSTFERSRWTAPVAEEINGDPSKLLLQRRAEVEQIGGHHGCKRKR